MAPLNLGILASSASGGTAPYIADSQHRNYGLVDQNDLSLDNILFASDFNVPDDAKFLLIVAGYNNGGDEIAITENNASLQEINEWPINNFNTGFGTPSQIIGGGTIPGLVGFGFRQYSGAISILLLDINWVANIWANGNGIALRDDGKQGYVSSIEAAIIAGDVAFDADLWADGTNTNGASGLPEVPTPAPMSFQEPADLLIFGAGMLSGPEISMGPELNGAYELESSGSTTYSTSTVLYSRLEEGVSSPFTPPAWAATGSDSDGWIGTTFALRNIA